MRYWIILLFSILLTACTTPRTAEDAFREGKYMESIELIAQFVEEKGQSKLSADDLLRFQNIVNDVMAHYENYLLTAERSNYKARINCYAALLKMKNRLSNRFYSQQIYFFNNKYDLVQLRKLLAEEYYLYGNSITATDSKGYKQKADLYQTGAEYYNYKDIAKLYEKNLTKYVQTAAAEFYQEGQRFTKEGEYKLAASQFLKASNVYKPLGKYKDSEKLYVEYDKKYRTAEAQKYYADATQLAKTTTSRNQYRKIADLYQKAVSIYSPYGQYKDAKTLADTYTLKGLVNVYIEPSQYSTSVREKLAVDSAYLKEVNNSQSADVIIRITLNDSYSQPLSRTNTEAMSENVVVQTTSLTNAETGKIEQQHIYQTYHFTQRAIESSNRLELQAKILVTGEISYANSHHVIQQSSKTNYDYYGDVPSKFKPYSKGTLLTKEQLYRKANTEIKPAILSDANIILQHIRNL